MMIVVKRQLAPRSQLRPRCPWRDSVREAERERWSRRRLQERLKSTSGASRLHRRPLLKLPPRVSNLVSTIYICLMTEFSNYAIYCDSYCLGSFSPRWWWWWGK